MSQTRQFVEEMTGDLGVLAAAGSTSPPDVQNIHATLDYSRGKEIQKVILSDQQRSQMQFLQSGLTAVMEDQKASHMMMDTAVQLIENGTANFGFIFNKALTVRRSRFEENADFERKRVCGRGVSGVVEAFQDRRSQLPFVRKRFQKGSHIRKEEVQSLIRLNHPGIVKVYALLCAGGTVDLLMQDAGHPLRACLKMFYEKRIPSEKYWQVVEDLAKQGFEALRYVHQQRICHLDVKPENLLVHQASNKSLVLVLADFGSSVTLSQTMTFNLGLTPEYWAPELWCHMEAHLNNLKMKEGSVQGYHRFSPQASFDSYAMSLCVYNMATCEHLMKQLEARQKTDSPPVPPQEVEQACRLFHLANPDFAFKFVLMRHYSDQMPRWATAGSWLFPGIPATLLTLIQNTLHPDPGERWTDEQATKFLSGKDCRGEAETPLAQKEEPDLKTPTQVEDGSPYCADQPEQAEGHALPAHEATHHVPVLTEGVPREAPPGQMDQPEVMSTGMQRFQETIAPYLRCWDQTAGLLLEPTQQKQTVVTNMAMPDSTHQVTLEDTVIGSYPQACQGSAPRLQCAEQADVSRDMLSLRTSVFTSMDLQGYGDEEETEKVTQGDWKRESENLWGLKPQADAVDGAGMKGQGGWEGDQTQDWGEKAEDSFMKVVGNLEGLTMHSQARSVYPACMKPPSAVGVKGKRGGKGKVEGRRRPGVKQREVIDKVKVSTAITKAKSQDKKVLRGKHLPLMSAQLRQPVPEVPFVVASSSRPKPSARMMTGLPLTCGNPGFRAGSTVSEQVWGSLVLVRPPDDASCTSKGQLGDGGGVESHVRRVSIQPQREALLVGDSSLLTQAGLRGQSVTGSTVPSVNDHQLPSPVGDPLQVCWSESEGQGPVSVIANQELQQQVSVAGHLKVPASGTAGVVPSCWTEAAVPELGTPVRPQSAEAGTEVEMEPLDQTEVEELLLLLEAKASKEQLQNLQVSSEGQELMVEVGEALAQYPSLEEDMYVTHVNEISPGENFPAIMSEGIPMTNGCEPDLDEDFSVDAQGNVPDFAKLLDP